MTLRILLLPASRAVAASLLLLPLTGCGVLLVAGTAASLAVDATVGVVKVTGKVAGAAIDAVLPSSENK